MDIYAWLMGICLLLMVGIIGIGVAAVSEAKRLQDEYIAEEKVTCLANGYSSYTILTQQGDHVFCVTKTGVLFVPGMSID